MATTNPHTLRIWVTRQPFFTCPTGLQQWYEPRSWVGDALHYGQGSLSCPELRSRVAATTSTELASRLECYSPVNVQRFAARHVAGIISLSQDCATASVRRSLDHYGHWAGRPAQCHSRTERNSFPLLRSSVRGSLSLTLSAVDVVVAVAVEQHQVSVSVVQPITVPVMHFDHVLCCEV